ncbi:MAG: ATP synthase F1 subunit delta [Ferruginibacter sp.]
MNNPRLAGRYAKSLLDLAIEQDKLDAVYHDMKFLLSVNNSNPDFVAILKSPVIATDKKEKIIESITNGRVNEITTLFIRLLMRKTRESNLPEIVRAFIEQYNKLKNIHPVKITTAVAMSEELKSSLITKIKTNPELQNIELQELVEDELIGGFKLEMGDILVDASISRDLHDVKKQFLSNEYIHRLR